MKTPREKVLYYYPYAGAINIGTRKGRNFYEIHSDTKTQKGFVNWARLGRGKSQKAAWRAAYRNLSI